VEGSAIGEREGHEVAVDLKQFADLEDNLLRQVIQRHFESFKANYLMKLFQSSTPKCSKNDPI